MKIMHVDNYNDIPRNPSFYQHCTYFQLQGIALERVEDNGVRVYGLVPTFFMNKPTGVRRELVGYATIGKVNRVLQIEPTITL